MRTHGNILAVLLLSVVLPLGGCLSTNSTLQTAQVLKPGEWQVGGAFTVPVATRFVSEIADAVDAITARISEADTTRPLTEEEEREAVATVLGIVLFQPSPLTVLDLRRGMGRNVDVGLRMAGPAFKLDGKWQFAHMLNGVDAALSAGLTYHTGPGASFLSGAFDLLDSLKLAEYSRRDLDVALLVSTDSNKLLGYYGALRYVAAFTSFGTRLDETVPTTSGMQSYDVSGVMQEIGTSAGVRFGTQRFRLIAELTVMRILYTPEVLGAPTELGGWFVEPALGLSLTW